MRQSMICSFKYIQIPHCTVYRQQCYDNTQTKKRCLTDQQVVKDVIDNPPQTKAVDGVGKMSDKGPNLAIEWHLAFPFQN